MKDPKKYTKIELGFSKLSRALISLEEIVFKPVLEDRSNIDATIQRFEFTIELFWKLLTHLTQTSYFDVNLPTH